MYHFNCKFAFDCFIAVFYILLFLVFGQHIKFSFEHNKTFSIFKSLIKYIQHIKEEKQREKLIQTV